VDLMIEFAIPLPPSVNAIYRVTRRARGRRIYKSERAIAWLEEAGISMRGVGRIDGPVSIDIVCGEIGARRNRDLDNVIKPIIDLIVQHRVIADDSAAVVRMISARWDGARLGALVRIIPIGATEFRYVARGDVAEYESRGWRALDSLDGTHHGDHAVLMVCSATPDTLPGSPSTGEASVPAAARLPASHRTSLRRRSP
jgi:Holliday junction resolvase RusA-like endonuclease